MRRWSDFVPQARQVAEGVRSAWRGEITRDTEVEWAKLALSILSALVTEATIISDESARPPYEDEYYLNCAFLLECGFHIEMPQWLGMCGEYAWGSI